MNLPKVILELVKAQDSFDSVAYANCFSVVAEVHDEGKTHIGRKSIQQWITEANEKYKTVITPLKYEEIEQKGILIAEASGEFPGSPIVLKYNFNFQEGLIESLSITS